WVTWLREPAPCQQGFSSWLSHSGNQEIKCKADPELYGDLPERISNTLYKLGLKDDSGYRSQLFQDFENNLISEIRTDEFYVNSFVDKIAHNMKKNNYFLHAIAGVMQHSDLDAINEHEEYIAQNMSDWLALAITVDALTEAQAKDIDFLEACMNTWDDDRRQQGGLLRSLGFSATVKLLSVDKPVKDGMRYRRNGQLDRSFTRNMLPFNIIEAVIYDIAQGNFDNAAAGLVLAKNHPGKYSDASAELLSDSTVKIKVPCPEHWADLYNTWNMAFVSDFNSMPYFTSILIVPSVSGYREWSCEEYMARRAYLLRSMLKYFSNLDESKRSHASPVASITRQWGRVNKASARHYESLIYRTYHDRNEVRVPPPVIAGS
ncbi:hypothetical protein, partial [Kistimonas scapharcae]|uniref:hypothetical protein n=1 Tax=Kistimonas scapharcae TaxID=1036133 RepID=UPI0031F10F56